MQPTETVNILWFKRDLRLRDHAPLRAAIAAGKPLLLLYCFEPSVMADPNYDLRHWRFVHESLTDLSQQLSAVVRDDTPVQLVHEWLPFEFDDAPVSDKSIDTGLPNVWVFQREVTDVLRAVQEQFIIDTIFSSEETGLRVTYDRDKAVAKYCREGNVS